MSDNIDIDYIDLIGKMTLVIKASHERITELEEQVAEATEKLKAAEAKLAGVLKPKTTEETFCFVKSPTGTGSCTKPKGHDGVHRSFTGVQWELCTAKSVAKGSCTREVNHPGAHQAADKQYWYDSQVGTQATEAKKVTCGVKHPNQDTYCDKDPAHSGAHQGMIRLSEFVTKRMVWPNYAETKRKVCGDAHPVASGVRCLKTFGHTGEHTSAANVWVNSDSVFADEPEPQPIVCGVKNHFQPGLLCTRDPGHAGIHGNGSRQWTTGESVFPRCGMPHPALGGVTCEHRQNHTGGHVGTGALGKLIPWGEAPAEDLPDDDEGFSEESFQ